MNMTLHYGRIAVLLAGLTLAAVPAEAGLRDFVDNIRDTMQCTKEAVFLPLTIVKKGVEEFETMSSQRYNRMADKAVNEVRQQCRESVQNIVSRAFGVGEITEKVDKIAGWAKATKDKIGAWQGKDKAVRALSVNIGERQFYTKETGLLGQGALPTVALRPQIPAVDPWADDGHEDAWEDFSQVEADPWAPDDSEVEEAWDSLEDETYGYEQTFDDIETFTEFSDNSTESAENDYQGALAAFDQQETEQRLQAERQRQEQLRMERQRAERRRRRREAREREEAEAEAEAEAEWEWERERMERAAGMRAGAARQPTWNDRQTQMWNNLQTMSQTMDTFDNSVSVTEDSSGPDTPIYDPCPTCDGTQ